MDLVPDGEQRLKRHHDFVVFDEVAGDEENLLGSHGDNVQSSMQII